MSKGKSIYLHNLFRVFKRGAGAVSFYRNRPLYDYSPNIRLQTISALITAMGRPAPGVVEAPT